MAKKDDGEGEASEGCGPDEVEGCQAIPFGAQVAGVPLAKDLCLLRDGGCQIKGVRGDIVLEGRRSVRRGQERGMGTYIVADTRTRTQHGKSAHSTSTASLYGIPDTGRLQECRGMTVALRDRT